MFLRLQWPRPSAPCAVYWQRCPFTSHVLLLLLLLLLAVTKTLGPVCDGDMPMKLQCEAGMRIGQVSTVYGREDTTTCPYAPDPNATGNTVCTSGEWPSKVSQKAAAGITRLASAAATTRTPRHERASSDPRVFMAVCRRVCTCPPARGTPTLLKSLP